MTDRPGPLILIVDDNEQNAKLARAVLRAAGLRTIEAATGAAAVARASRDQPDAILLDLRLPDGDGTEFARRLKADPGTAHIPVIAFTSLAPQDVGEWFQEAGFDGFIEKPIRVLEFPEQVRRFAEG